MSRSHRPNSRPSASVPTANSLAELAACGTSHGKPGPAIGQSHARLTKLYHGPFPAGHLHATHHTAHAMPRHKSKRKTKLEKMEKLKWKN